MHTKNVIVKCTCQILKFCFSIFFATWQADDLDPDKDDETPNAEMIERMVEKLEAAQSQQKNLFLILFQVNNCLDRYMYLYTHSWLQNLDILQYTLTPNT